MSTLAEVKQALWELLSADADVRCRAASTILQGSLHLPDEDFAYTCRRLVAGLVSSVQGAREGFSLALCACLRQLRAAEVEATGHRRQALILDALHRAYDLEGVPTTSDPLQNVKHVGDAREIALARLFALGAVLGSWEPSHCESLPPLQLGGILEVLAHIADQDTKNFAEACGRLACEAVAKLCVDRSLFRAGSGARAAVLRYWKRRQRQGRPTLDALAVMLFCRNRYTLRASEADCPLWGQESPCRSPELLRRYVVPVIEDLSTEHSPVMPRAFDLLLAEMDADVTPSDDGNAPARKRHRSGDSSKAAWIMLYEQVVAPHLFSSKHPAHVALALRLCMKALQIAASSPCVQAQDWRAMLAHDDWNEHLWNVSPLHRKHAHDLEPLLKALTDALVALLGRRCPLSTSLAEILWEKELQRARGKHQGSPAVVVLEAAARHLRATELARMVRSSVDLTKLPLLVRGWNESLRRGAAAERTECSHKVLALLDSLAALIESGSSSRLERQHWRGPLFSVAAFIATWSEYAANEPVPDWLGSMRSLLGCMQRKAQPESERALCVCTAHLESLAALSEHRASRLALLTLALVLIVAVSAWSAPSPSPKKGAQRTPSEPSDLILHHCVPFLDRCIEHLRTPGLDGDMFEIELTRLCLQLLRLDDSGVRSAVDVIFASMIASTQQTAAVLRVVLGELPGLADQDDTSTDDLDDAEADLRSSSSESDAPSISADEATTDASDTSDASDVESSRPLVDLQADLELDMDEEEPAVLAAYDAQLVAALKPLVGERRRTSQLSASNAAERLRENAFHHRVLDLVQIAIRYQTRAAGFAPVTLMDLLGALHHAADFIAETQGTDAALYTRLVYGVLGRTQRAAAAASQVVEAAHERAFLESFQSLLEQVVALATARPHAVRFTEHDAVALHAGIRLALQAARSAQASTRMVELLSSALLQPILNHYLTTRGRVVSAEPQTRSSIAVSSLVTFLGDLGRRMPAVFACPILEALHGMLANAQAMQQDGRHGLRSHALLECWAVVLPLATSMPTVAFLSVERRLPILERWIEAIAAWNLGSAGQRKLLKLSQPFLRQLAKDLNTLTSSAERDTYRCRIRCLVESKLQVLALGNAAGSKQRELLDQVLQTCCNSVAQVAGSVRAIS